MEELNYDVAREFIKRGKRIEPKYHPPSWYAQRHYTNTIHIGEYILWCEYDCWSHVTSVHISIPHGKIPFEIANAIYMSMLKK